MKPFKIRFFFDYGTCFWNADDRLGNYALGGKDLPLSPSTRIELDTLVQRYDQSYSYGCPPFPGWTGAACEAFNRHYRRILELVGRELLGKYIICNEQIDLITDDVLLLEFERCGRDFIEERVCLIEKEM